MTSQHPRPEDSLALAMIELDRLERERQDIEDQRREAHSLARRQAKDIRELERALRLARPRAVARELARTNAEHRRSLAHQRSLSVELEREHAERLARIARENAERRATLDALALARASEPAAHPAQAALRWLTPFAATALVALVGLFAMHEGAAASFVEAPAPLAAVADEPANRVDAQTEASPPVLSDAPSEPAAIAEPDPVPTTAPTKSTKPATKSTKSATKSSTAKPTKTAKPSEPQVKPRTRPIVLSGGDDPLGDL